jgi:uncharacterized membrane protein
VSIIFRKRLASCSASGSGFFDGIVLHQLLQWHHLLSSWYPVNSVETLQLNTLWDGIFHSATHVFVVAGLFVLWRSAQRRHQFWSSKLLAGTMLLCFGLFNTAEGIINHHVLGLHHVNETDLQINWIYWDVAFTISGLAMLAVGGPAHPTGRARNSFGANVAEPRMRSRAYGSA